MSKGKQRAIFFLCPDDLYQKSDKEGINVSLVTTFRCKMHSTICITFVIFLSLCTTEISAKLACRNEKNFTVDWFVNYKLPKNSRIRTNTLVRQGRSYAYFASDSLFSDWKLSDTDIASESSMLGRTLASFYSNKDTVSYLLYNDESPNEDDGSSVGHTKGVVVFDDNSGFWIIHSIPRFPPEESYIYPSSGFDNGQSILCMTFPTSELNEIGKQLIYNAPYSYAYKLTSSIAANLDDDVKSLFSERPVQIRRAPFTRITDLQSVGGIEFKSFAKDNQFNGDLYSEIIAPELKSSMVVETWRRGSGTPSEPVCKLKYRVLDVNSINMTVITTKKPPNIFFSSMQDHSKWAITRGGQNGSQWVCIGDINRMESQKRRGGGAACFISSDVWKIYNSSIAATDQC